MVHDRRRIGIRSYSSHYRGPDRHPHETAKGTRPKESRRRGAHAERAELGPQQRHDDQKRRNAHDQKYLGSVRQKRRRRYGRRRPMLPETGAVHRAAGRRS